MKELGFYDEWPEPEYKLTDRQAVEMIREANRDRKKAWKLHCALCGEDGHNRRTCPTKENECSLTKNGL